MLKVTVLKKEYDRRETGDGRRETEDGRRETGGGTSIVK